MKYLIIIILFLSCRENAKPSVEIQQVADTPVFKEDLTAWDKGEQVGRVADSVIKTFPALPPNGCRHIFTYVADTTNQIICIKCHLIKSSLNTKK
jgi:hypothetical protein